MKEKLLKHFLNIDWKDYFIKLFWRIIFIPLYLPLIIVCPLLFIGNGLIWIISGESYVYEIENGIENYVMYIWNETFNRYNSNSIYTFSNFITWFQKNIKFNKKEQVIISDPNNILDQSSMQLYAKRGHKVMVTERTINNGYQGDKDYANKYLEIGKIYTVEAMWVHDWNSDVELQEIPDKKFNSVHFIDYKE